MEYKELRLFSQKLAMTYGLYLGLYLAIRFVLTVYAQSFILISSILPILAIGIPILAYIFARKLKVALGGSVTFGLLFSFIFYLFVFSSLILACVEYIYYAFINPDFLSAQAKIFVDNIDVYLQILPNLASYKEELLEAGGAAIDPLSVAVQNIWVYGTGGVIYGLIIAAILRTKNENKIHNNEPIDNSSAV